MTATRQRGVRASRPKLEKRLREAGLKSQADLARRMADMEGLHTPPKDLVNRVFRQQKVEYASLERVARALEIDSYELYLSREDVERQGEASGAAKGRDIAAPAGASASDTEAPMSGKVWRAPGVLAAIAVLVACLISLSVIYAGGEGEAPPPMSSTLNTLVYPTEQSLYPLAAELLRTPGARRLALLPQALHQGFVLDGALARYEVDQVLLLSSARSGRYRLLHVRRFTGEDPQPLASLVLSDNELSQAAGYVGQRLAELAASTVGSRGDPAADAQWIVRARQLTEEYYDAEKMGEAQALLGQVTQNTASSLALQCLIHAAIGWHGNEKSEFLAAQTACEEALALDASHPFVVTADAYRRLRNGEFDAAEAAYEAVLERHPGHIEGLLGMAELHMQRYLQDPESAALRLQGAITLAREAIAQDPGYWRGYQQLSTYHYLARDTDKAMAVLQELNALAPHPLSLANGALLSLCHNRMDDAAQYAQRLLKMDDASYIAYETLFQIATYQHRPGEALDAMERAMARFDRERGGLYLQWGQLGDAYRRAGEADSAVASYEEALVEFSQDQAKGLVTANDAVFALYFEAAIAALTGGSLGVHLQEGLDRLDVATMPSSHQLRAAVLYHWLGLEADAMRAREQAVAACPVYRRLPDLATLLTE